MTSEEELQIQETEQKPVSTNHDKRGRFAPGNRASVGHDASNAGRPKGSPTRMRESFEMVKNIKDEIVDTLVSILRGEPQNAQKVSRAGLVVDYLVYPSFHDRYEVAKELLDRAYGKPKQTFDVNANNETDHNYSIQIIYNRADAKKYLEGRIVDAEVIELTGFNGDDNDDEEQQSEEEAR